MSVTCVSCGEEYEPRDVPLDGLTKPQAKLMARERWKRCAECALEVVTGQVDMSPAKLTHDCGGGRRVIRSTRGLS